MFPFLSKMNENNWGSCEENQKEEQLHAFRRFNNDLIESIKNSKTEIVLEVKGENLNKFISNKENVNA